MKLNLEVKISMDSKEFPLILSPNLGCPKIISREDLKCGEYIISLIIAWQDGEFSDPLDESLNDSLYLRPFQNKKDSSNDIPLKLAKAPVEIKDWNLLSGFSVADDTRKLINSELHYKVLGEGTRYWEVTAKFDHKGDIYSLYDLVLKDNKKKLEKINYHALQIVESIKKEFNFIHLTDLHTSKRNDEILDEVLKVKNARDYNSIYENYINFNENFRTFIKTANEMADRNELDFVVITGDLVDFAFHGWEDESSPDENNWRNFINIVTGAGDEKEKMNPGIKVPIFTSTGNHDWRLHPYNPNLLTKGETFGLRKDELKNYNYKSFDSTEFPDSKRAERSKELTSATMTAFDKGAAKLTPFIIGKAPAWIRNFLTALALLGTGREAIFTNNLKFLGGYRVWLPLLAFGLLLYLLRKILRNLVERRFQKYIDYTIDNPLHAEGKALHYYFKHINPYLDYAFTYNNHSFVVMDTGSDIFDGQIQDNKDPEALMQLSLEDNILGGSPDSRAFDAKQVYCNWSQIVWLEKALSIKKKTGNLFVFLHAPPINSKDKAELKDLKESKVTSEPKWVPEEIINLTHGTINHFLSQFFYLCLGYRESALDNGQINPRTTLVFSGHAHKNIEFRITKDMNKNHKVRIYFDEYSNLLKKNDSAEKWWNINSPVIVQTASCSLKGDDADDKEPPYYRQVTVNEEGHVTEFRTKKIKNNTSYFI
jgi:Icc-related predicted phosphoesterase